VTGTARLLKDLTLWANYTWLIEAKDLTANTDLLRRPEHSGNVGAITVSAADSPRTPTPTWSARDRI